MASPRHSSSWLGYAEVRTLIFQYFNSILYDKPLYVLHLYAAKIIRRINLYILKS